MSELKAVLFDVDGTLSETERYGHLVAMNEAFKTVGLDWQWSQFDLTGSAPSVHIQACPQ